MTQYTPAKVVTLVEAGGPIYQLNATKLVASFV